MSAPNNPNQAALAFSSNGDNTIVAAVTGRPIAVWKISVVNAGAVTVSMKNGASTTLATYTLAGAGAITEETAGTFPLFWVTPGNAFIIGLSSGVSCTGSVWYSLG